jgi:hypothetical protein
MILTTLDNYKIHCKLPNLTDVNQLALMTQFLDTAEAKVIEKLHYNPLEDTYTETFSVYADTDCIILNAKPISELASITIDGITHDVSKFYAKDEFIFVRNGNKLFLSTEKNNIEIEFTAGYTLADMPPVITITVFAIADILSQEQSSRLLSEKQYPDGTSVKYISTSAKFEPFLDRLSSLILDRGLF